jgi:hypothetical protein
MGSQKCGTVGKSQPVLIMINPMIFTRPRASCRHPGTENGVAPLGIWRAASVRLTIKPWVVCVHRHRYTCAPRGSGRMPFCHAVGADGEVRY